MFDLQRVIVRELQINETLEQMVALNALRSESTCDFERALCSAQLATLGARARLFKLSKLRGILSRVDLC